MYCISHKYGYHKTVLRIYGIILYTCPNSRDHEVQVPVALMFSGFRRVVVPTSSHLRHTPHPLWLSPRLSPGKVFLHVKGQP